MVLLAFAGVVGLHVGEQAPELLQSQHSILILIGLVEYSVQVLYLVLHNQFLLAEAQLAELCVGHHQELSGLVEFRSEHVLVVLGTQILLKVRIQIVLFLNVLYNQFLDLFDFDHSDILEAQVTQEVLQDLDL